MYVCFPTAMPSIYSLVLIVMGVSDVLIILCVLVYFIRKRKKEILQNFSTFMAEKGENMVLWLKRL